MSADKRFEKVFSDPRFMVAPKKVSKVKIDSRFQTMFKDKQFNVVAKVDKYGKKLDRKDNYALQNYYKGDESGSGSSDEDGENPEKKTKKARSKSVPEAADQDSASDAAGEKYYDSDGRFHWSGASSSGSDSDENADKSKKKKKHAKTEEKDGEDAESDFNEDVDSASYSDDLSGVWSLDD